MATKLDMGRAWSHTTAMIAANRDVMLIVAAVFVLLPNLAFSLLVQQPDELIAMQNGADADPEIMIAMLTEWFAGVWWAFLILGLMQAVGTIGLLALLNDRARPTVGEALGFAARALPTYLATQIIIGVAISGIFALVLLIGQVSPGFGALLGLLGMLGAMYAMLKLSLVTPVIGIEKQMGPIAALKRSWRLTKGNSLLILAFFLLLIIAFLVVSMVAGLLFAAFALLGDEVGLIVGALGNAVLSAALVMVLVAALAAVHRQLAGIDQSAVGTTFE